MITRVDSYCCGEGGVTEKLPFSPHTLNIASRKTPHREPILTKILESFLTTRPHFQARIPINALLSLLVSGDLAWLGDAAEAEAAVEDSSQDVFVGLVAPGD